LRTDEDDLSYVLRKFENKLGNNMSLIIKKYINKKYKIYIKREIFGTFYSMYVKL